MIYNVGDVRNSLLAWKDDIPLFARTALGIELRPKQVEFVNAFHKHQRITMRGGVGFGKTTAACVIILWAVVCHDDMKMTIFGPTEGNLKTGLWADLKVMFHKLPPLIKANMDVNESKVIRKDTPSSFAEMKIANKDNPEAARGQHAFNNFILVDEASGVDDRIFSVLQNIFTDPNPKLCLISNPTKTTGFFFDTHNHPVISQDWHKLVGKATDNPLLTPEALAAQIRGWGGPLSRETFTNVHGEFPLSDEDGLIPRNLVEEAARATSDEVLPTAGFPVVWGLDVAGPGTDRSVLVKRQDNVVLGIVTWQGLDTTQLAAAVKIEYDKTPKPQRPAAIAVDAIGLGQGVFDQLQHTHGLPAKRIAVSNSPTKHPERYHRLRDQLWVEAKDWLAEGDKRIPADIQLIEELCMPRYEITNGKIKVEDKKSLRRRGRKSPDVADAFVLTFAVSVASLRSGGKYSWGKAIDYGSMAWAQ